jgi:membrane protease YdiL (CAAX protease family)
VDSTRSRSDEETEHTGSDRVGLPAIARRRPVAVFLVLGIGTGWASLAVPVVTGLPAMPFLLLMLVILLGSALLVTGWADGPGGVRQLLVGVLRWRFHPGRYAVILLGMPAATLAVAALAGTANLPDDWGAFALTHLLQTVVWGALLANVWEETAWTGFLQARLMNRHGLLIGSLLTASWFVANHLPLSFLPGWTWHNVAINLGLLAVAAPVMRYLLGMHYLGTRGSLLAVGLQHSAFNASSSLGLAGWEYVGGLVVLTVLVAAAHHTTKRAAR